MEENTTCPPDPSTQCSEVPFDGLGTFLCYLIPVNLHYQEGIIIRRPHQTREFLRNIPNPGPREAADFPAGTTKILFGGPCCQTRSAYSAACQMRTIQPEKHESLHLNT